MAAPHQPHHAGLDSLVMAGLDDPVMAGLDPAILTRTDFANNAIPVSKVGSAAASLTSWQRTG
jgi:hypothetical protein